MAVYQGSRAYMGLQYVPNHVDPVTNFFKELPPAPEIQAIQPQVLQQKIAEIARSALLGSPIVQFVCHTEARIREKGGIILTRDRGMYPELQYRGIVALPAGSNKVLLHVSAGLRNSYFTERNLDELFVEAAANLALKNLVVAGVSPYMGRTPQLTLPAFEAWRAAQIARLSQ